MSAHVYKRQLRGLLAMEQAGARWLLPVQEQDPLGDCYYPWEIVLIFEKYGFIWGGKWHHYDTVHFEYRPEMLSSAT